jgi:uncharacterized protein (DUF433 family)
MPITPAFTRDPEIHSGAAVFPGTRGPIAILFDYLIAEPDGLNQFLEDYDHISREAVNAVLEYAKHALTDPDDLAA